MIWKSKKFWVAVSGVLAVLLHETMKIPEETTLQVTAIIIAYLLGQGVADLGKYKAQ